MASPLKICIVASEVTPYAKTGGLADVAAALGRHLARAGADARVVMPMYRRVAGVVEDLRPLAAVQDVGVKCGDRTLHFSVSTARLPGSSAPVWFVRCPELYDRDGIYEDRGDEHLRFGLLNRAAIETCQRLQWAPDVIHCNDWHTALIPLYLRAVYGWDRMFANTKTLLSIHNIGYQGMYSTDVLDSLELGGQRSLLYQEDVAEGRVNFLKTGILYADALSTVSETYAREVQTEEYGMGLHELLRARSDHFFGIVNGVDYDDWNPSSDRWIPAHYDAKDLAGKAACKRHLLQSAELPVDDRAPVLGIVSRLTAQKGFDLLPDVLPVFLQRLDMRLVVLGSGEQRYEDYFRWLQGQYPRKVVFHAGYSEEIAHHIEAGSDLFLMPSRYEPCGLNQMYSLRYGTIPVVRQTGGLADTVEPWNAEKRTGNGFVFERFEDESLFRALEFALHTWSDREAWQVLVQNAMRADWSWEKQIRHYLDLYGRMVGSA